MSQTLPSEETSDRFTQLEHNLEQLINRRFDTLQQSNAHINTTLSSRKVVVDELTRENHALQQHVKTLEGRLLKLERQVNNTEQNNRKNNIEIDGIPASVNDDDLREVVAILLNHITESDIMTSDIEAAHRLPSKTSPKPTIVRMKRNLIEEAKSKEARTKLKDIAVKMNFPRGTRIYVNDNQSPNMRSLAYNARLLKNAGLITETWFSNAAVRIKRSPQSKTIKITHEKDLVDEFPTFDDFTFDMKFYRKIQDDEDIDRYDNLGGSIDRDDEDVPIKNSVPPSASEIANIIANITAATQERIGADGATGGDENDGSKSAIVASSGNCDDPNKGVRDVNAGNDNVAGDANVGVSAENGDKLNGAIGDARSAESTAVSPSLSVSFASPSNPHVTRSRTSNRPLAHALFMGN